MQKKLLSAILFAFLMVSCFSVTNLNAQCPPDGVQGTYVFNDPAPSATDCSAFTQSQYTVWSNENYQVSDIVMGQTYVVDMCNAPGTFNAILGVYDPSNNLVASDDGTASGCGDGALVSFTATVSGTYSITVGNAACENTGQGSENGTILIFNNSDGVECPPSTAVACTSGNVDANLGGPDNLVTACAGEGTMISLATDGTEDLSVACETEYTYYWAVFSDEDADGDGNLDLVNLFNIGTDPAEYNADFDVDALVADANGALYATDTFIIAGVAGCLNAAGDAFADVCLTPGSILLSVVDATDPACGGEPECGNGICEEGEDSDNCPGDCPPVVDGECATYAAGPYTDQGALDVSSCDNGGSVVADYAAWDNEVYWSTVVAGASYTINFDGCSQDAWGGPVTITVVEGGAEGTGTTDAVSPLPGAVLASVTGACSVDFVAQSTGIVYFTITSNCGGTVQQIDNGTATLTTTSDIDPADCLGAPATCNAGAVDPNLGGIENTTTACFGQGETIALATDGTEDLSVACETEYTYYWAVFSNQDIDGDGNFDLVNLFNIGTDPAEYNADFDVDALVTDANTGTLYEAADTFLISGVAGCLNTAGDGFADVCLTIASILLEVSPANDPACGGTEPVCGNGICEEGEDSENCPGDCPPVVAGECTTFAAGPYTDQGALDVSSCDNGGSVVADYAAWDNEVYWSTVVAGASYTINFDGCSQDAWGGPVTITVIEGGAEGTGTTDAVSPLPGAVLASVTGACSVDFVAQSTGIVYFTITSNCGGTVQQIDNGTATLTTTSDIDPADCLGGAVGGVCTPGEIDPALEGVDNLVSVCFGQGATVTLSTDGTEDLSQECETEYNYYWAVFSDEDADGDGNLDLVNLFNLGTDPAAYNADFDADALFLDANGALYAEDTFIIAGVAGCLNTAGDGFADVCLTAGSILVDVLSADDPACNIVEVDCPELGLNVGDTCDDGDAGTENDAVDANCNCTGTPVVMFDCPELMANIGDECDDNNPNTEMDMITMECGCMGTPTGDCAAAAGTFEGVEAIYCGGDIVVAANGFNADPAYSQFYVITTADADLTILAVNQTGEFTLEPGSYVIHLFNVDSAEVPPGVEDIILGLPAQAIFDALICYNVVSSDAVTVYAEDAPECQAVTGCTDETACNYDPLATEDDGTCIFAIGGMITTESETLVCVGDSIPDIVSVSVEGNVGTNYAYVITNEDGTILLGGPTTDTEFDFDGAPAGTCLIWGVAYEGELTVSAVGEPLVIEGDCYQLSNPISVVRQDCSCPADGGVLATDSETTVCVGDGTEDEITVSVEGATGETYVYLITNGDASILLAGPLEGPVFGFDGAPPGVCLIWGLSYDGDILLSDEGAPLSIEGDCWALSNPIEVNRIECGGDPLELGEVTSTVDAATGTYVITFDIEEGSGDYSSEQGAVVGNVFTSNPIPCGETYEVTIIDNATGETASVMGLISCVDDCEASIGAQSGDPDTTIDPGEMSEAYDFGFTTADGYVSGYVLTTDLDCNDPASGYNIVGFNTTGIFDFSSPELSFEGGGIGPGCFAGGGLYNVYAISFFGTLAELENLLFNVYQTGEALEMAVDNEDICADMPSLGDVEEGAYSIFIIPPCDADAGDISMSNVDDFVCGGELVTVGSSDFEAGADYSQVYILTFNDADFTIVNINTTGTFTTPATGEYTFHALNVLSEEVTGLDLNSLIGQSALAVLGTLECFDLDTADEPFVVLDPISVEVDYNCDINTGTYTLAVSFSGGMPAWAAANGGNAEDFFYTASGDLNGDFDVDANELLENTDNSPYSITVTDSKGCTDSESGTPPSCTKTAVEFLGLEGRAETAGNYLYWATASEENNDYFNVERSLNGVDFEVIGKVNGVGNSNVTSNYDFTDATSPAGTAIYRLAMVDFDGKVELSNTISIARNSEGFGITNISPVPATEFINVSFNTFNTTTVITIVDIAGKEIMTKEVATQEGENTTQLSVESFSAGVYFLNITNGNSSSIEKFIVK